MSFQAGVKHFCARLLCNLLLPGGVLVEVEFVVDSPCLSLRSVFNPFRPSLRFSIHPPSRSTIWAYLLLLAQSFSVVLTLSALMLNGDLGFSIGLLSPSHFNEEEKNGAMLAAFDTLWPLHILAYVFICMFDPTRKRFLGPLQVMSILMGVSSRCLLMFHVRSSAAVISYLTGPIFVSCWVAVGLRQRCQRIKSEFTPQQVRIMDEHAPYIAQKKKKKKIVKLLYPSFRSLRRLMTSCTIHCQPQ